MSMVAQSPDTTIPFEVRVRFLTRRELHRLADRELERGGYLERTGTPDERNGHYMKFDVIGDEIARRDAMQQEREEKRLRRMIEAAKRWHEKGGAF